MKLKLLAAWTALASALGFETGKDQEIETTPEKLSELNSKLSKLDDVEKENTTLKADKAKLEKELGVAKTDLAAAQEEVKNLKSPEEAPKKPTKEGNEEVKDREDKDQFNFADPEVDYNARANKALGIKA